MANLLNSKVFHVKAAELSCCALFSASLVFLAWCSIARLCLYLNLKNAPNVSVTDESSVWCFRSFAQIVTHRAVIMIIWYRTSQSSEFKRLKFLDPSHPTIELRMSWISWIFECVTTIASTIAHLDYVYIEWLINLIMPFIIFIITLFLLPAVIIILTFGASFYIYFNKHRHNLLVSRCWPREMSVSTPRT